MPTLEIGGRDVEVGEDFLKLSPAQQNSTVEEIAGSLNIKPKAQSSFSLGPVSDVAEVGARGINKLAQMLPESIRPPVRKDGPLGQPVDLGILGRPSLIGLAKGVAEGAKSAATLPGDVYAGKVDPLSEEGIGRAANLAGFAQLSSSIPTAARRAATPALATEKIENAAKDSYNAIRERTKDVSLEMPGAPKADPLAALTGAAPKATTSYPFSAATAEHMEASLATANVKGELLRPETTRLIGEARNAKTLTELVDVREALGGVVRAGGNDGLAAGVARNALDDALGQEIAGITKTADRNYAISKRAGDIERNVANAGPRAQVPGRGGEGNIIRRAVEPLTLEGAKNVSPEVLASARHVTNPGVIANTLRAMSVFDPTSRLGFGLGMLNASSAPFTFGMHNAALPAAGLGARMMYDRMIRNRAGGVSEAIRSEAPASVVQPGYQAGGVLGMPQLPVPSPGGLLTLPPRERR